MNTKLYAQNMIFNNVRHLFFLAFALCVHVGGGGEGEHIKTNKDRSKAMSQTSDFGH